MAHVNDERLTALTERLEKGVQDIFTSGRFAEYLSFMARFHHYSFGNCMLILMQCPHATQVAGYTKWKKEFGRQVKKGERGIQILAPCTKRLLVDEEQIDPVTGQTAKEQMTVVKTYFKIATVFDVSQTEGKELPSLGVSELTGSTERYQEIYAKLVDFAPVPVKTEDFPGAAKGYFSYTEQCIVIRPGMSEVQTLKTLTHEIAHSLLHDPSQVPDQELKKRNEKEVEAESVAFVVCKHFGIDTSDYSFGYVAGWSSGKELDELKASLDRIKNTAAQIIDTIEAEPERTEPEKFTDRVMVIPPKRKMKSVPVR